MARAFRLLALFLIVEGLPAQAGTCTPPTWAHGKELQRRGLTLTVICHGEGATEDLAGIEAKSGCDSVAGTEYSSTVDVDDTVVTTDHDAANHRVIHNAVCVLGLECQNPKVSTCSQDGASTIWRQCTYDLAKARDGTPKDCADRSAPVARTGKDAVANRAGISSLEQKVQVQGAGAHQRGQEYVLTLSVTPICDDLVIVGHSGRRVHCSSNPVQLPVKSGDEKVIVRAKGYLPKTILLDATGTENHAEVFLDAAD